jgi:hypothetical protein
MVLPIPLKKKKTPRNLIETQRSHLLQKEFCIFRNPLFCLSMTVPTNLHKTSQKMMKRLKARSDQGCQMVYFQTKNTNLGKFWRVLKLKMLVYFIHIGSIFRPFGIFYSHLVYFPSFWYIFNPFGMLYQEKSGDPGSGWRAQLLKRGQGN